MKLRLSHLIVLVGVGAAPVQAGFWDSIKKGLGLKSGEAVEAVLNEEIVWNAKTASLQALNGTAIDSSTGLMWMRCAMGQTWQNDTCSGTAAQFTWNEATNLKHSFAGHQDWRLPTVRELQTLVEPGKGNPSINSAIFPGTPSSYFWSGSPSANDTSYAWFVSFSHGNAHGNYRGGGGHVRLVRGGQSLAFLAVHEIATAKEIQHLARSRQWHNVIIDYSKLAEIHLNQAQTTHQALPEQLKAVHASLQDAPSAPPKLQRDEFETSAAFQARLNQAQTRYEATVADYNQQVADYERQVKNHYAQLGPLPIEQRQNAIRTAFLNSHAAPRLSQLRYDADTQSFYANISNENGGNLTKSIALRDIPPERARSLKPQLEAAQPEVLFRINPDNSLTWASITLRAGNEKLAAVPVNTGASSADANTERLEVAIKTLDVATPKFDLPKPIGLQKSTFAIQDDANIAAQQAEVDRIKRERARAEARAAEMARLEQELIRLKQSAPAEFTDDLSPRLAQAKAGKPDKNLYIFAVGIGDYADVADVPYADRSAKLFAELAQKVLGASDENIIVLTNQEATSGRLRGRLRTLLGHLTEQDRLIIYFAGHGAPAQDGKQVFLLAQDSVIGSYEEPDLQLNALYRQVSQSGVGQAQLFIDACFSGRSSHDEMLFKGMGGVTIVPKHGVHADSRMTVITAGRAHQFSNWQEKKGHRLFGYHLMHALLDGGTQVSADKLHGMIKQKVLADSLRISPQNKQEPELLGNTSAVLKP